MSEAQIRDKIRKLEQVTEGRGATPAEAQTALRAKERLRIRLQEYVGTAPTPPRYTFTFSDPWDGMGDWSPEPPPERTHMPVGSLFNAVGGVVDGSVFDAVGAWRP